MADHGVGTMKDAGRHRRADARHQPLEKQELGDQGDDREARRARP
ncbi:hypothetical protein [Consotaella salsifontis]|nr:hypothetical protein [Consotaella salsifontis]